MCFVVHMYAPFGTRGVALQPHSSASLVPTSGAGTTILSGRLATSNDYETIRTRPRHEAMWGGVPGSSASGGIA